MKFNFNVFTKIVEINYKKKKKNIENLKELKN